MPDDTPMGRRLYLVRIAAAGMMTNVEPPQSTIDYASGLVQRVIEDAEARYRDVAGSLFALALAAGMMMGLAIGGLAGLLR